MDFPDLSSANTVLLVDTNVIIEAVRTNCWNALTGGRRVETVEECRDEALRGDSVRPDYVEVSPADLDRMAAVHPVTDIERATLAITYEGAEAMDNGERDLFAHALRRLKKGDEMWVLSSPDKSSVRAAVHLGWADRLHSLDAIISLLGTKPKPPLEQHYTDKWLSRHRTEYLLQS